VTGNPGFSTRVDRLRRSLTELGRNVDEIAAALGAELRLRSRVTYRYAVGMSGQVAADVYNTDRGFQSQHHRALVTRAVSQISEMPSEASATSRRGSPQLARGQHANTDQARPTQRPRPAPRARRSREPAPPPHIPFRGSGYSRSGGVVMNGWRSERR
jgi:methyl-accepting chemotaxis protein